MEKKKAFNVSEKRWIIRELESGRSSMSAAGLTMFAAFLTRFGAFPIMSAGVLSRLAATKQDVPFTVDGGAVELDVALMPDA